MTAAIADFAFGLAFDPTDRPAKAGAEREGPGRWRATIGGVRAGEHFYEWKSAETYPSCKDALSAAELARASNPTPPSDGGL